MTIRSQQSAFLPREPAQVFALLDDLSSAHRWMARCVRIRRYRPGEHAIDGAFRCVYQGVLGDGVLDGEIVARSPGTELACACVGRHLRIAFGFRLQRHREGTYLTHTVQLDPCSLLARLVAPLARRALHRQTTATLAGLRRYLLACDAR